MDLVQFFGYLRQFNADILVIGVAVWGLTAVLKRTLLKSIPKKYITLLPFVLGILLFTAYAAIAGEFSAGAFADIAASGITCGSLATVIHVVYEQFVRKQTKTDVRTACVKAVLAPYAELSDEDAKAIADAMEKGNEEAEELLRAYCADDTALALSILEKTLSTL